MPPEKDAIPDKAKDTSSRPRKRRTIPPGGHTEIGFAEIVVIGPNATINVNKSNYQDFIDIHKYGYEQGHDVVMDRTNASREASQSSSEITSKSLRTTAFISYSDSDKKYLNELHVHLAPYVRNDMIRFWDNTRIKPGVKWLEEIQKGLQSAKVAVFLVSPEFLASDFIATKELHPLLTAASEEGVIILSVILLPCAFEDSPLAQFQPVNAPSNPLSDMTKGQRNAVWVSVAECIKDA